MSTCLPECDLEKTGFGAAESGRFWNERSVRAIQSAAFDAGAVAREPATCTWTLDDDEYGIWQTTCDTTWSFTDGGPADNSCHYCHKCGGALVIVRPEPETDDDEDAV